MYMEESKKKKVRCITVIDNSFDVTRFMTKGMDKIKNGEVIIHLKKLVQNI